MVDNRNNVLGMITRKDITHHALDEALLRLHAQRDVAGTFANDTAEQTLSSSDWKDAAATEPARSTPVAALGSE